MENGLKALQVNASSWETAVIQEKRCGILHLGDSSGNTRSEWMDLKCILEAETKLGNGLDVGSK